MFLASENKCFSIQMIFVCFCAKQKGESKNRKECIEVWKNAFICLPKKSTKTPRNMEFMNVCTFLVSSGGLLIFCVLILVSLDAFIQLAGKLHYLIFWNTFNGALILKALGLGNTQILATFSFCGHFHYILNKVFDNFFVIKNPEFSNIFYKFLWKIHGWFFNPLTE